MYTYVIADYYHQARREGYRDRTCVILTPGTISCLHGRMLTPTDKLIDLRVKENYTNWIRKDALGETAAYKLETHLRIISMKCFQVPEDFKKFLGSPRFA